MWRLALLFAVPALAQTQGPDLRDVMQARNYAMGAAYHALGYGAESLTGNPAALSLYHRYTIEASGAWDMQNNFGVGSIAIADSATSAVAGGLQYQFVTYGNSDRRWAHLTTVGLAYGLADSVHLGLSVQHHVITGATNANSVTMAAGIIVKPFEFLEVGFSGHNLIPNYNPDLTRYFVASAGMMLSSQLTPCFDLRMDLNGPKPAFSYQMGIEWLISQTFPLRAGYLRDDIAHHEFLSGGVGWFSDGSGIDLAYRHELGGSKGRLLAVTLKLQL